MVNSLPSQSITACSRERAMSEPISRSSCADRPIRNGTFRTATLRPTRKRSALDLNDKRTRGRSPPTGSKTWVPSMASPPMGGCAAGICGRGTSADRTVFGNDCTKRVLSPSLPASAANCTGRTGEGSTRGPPETGSLGTGVGASAIIFSACSISSMSARALGGRWLGFFSRHRITTPAMAAGIRNPAPAC